MSTAASRPNSQTRQQLEELDALIQRMLSLPLAGDEVPPAAPSEQTFSSDNLPRPQSTPTLEVRSLPPSPAAETPPVPPAISQTSEVFSWRVEFPAITSPQPEPSVPFAEVAPTTPWSAPPEGLSSRFTLPSIVATPTTLKGAASIPGPPLVFGANPPDDVPMGEVVGSSADIPTALPFPAPRVIPTGSTQATRSSVPTFTPPPSMLLWPFIALNWMIDLVLCCFGPVGQPLRTNLGRGMLGWLGILMILGAIVWGITDWLGIEWPRQG